MRLKWAPSVVLALGVMLTMSVSRQRPLPLQRSMAEVVPVQIHGYLGRDVQVSAAEARVAAFSNYLFRVYEGATQRLPSVEELTAVEGPEEALPWFSLYAGYYEAQVQGNTIHSPKNCLPGAGWKALSSGVQTVEVDGRAMTVNRYLLQNGSERSLALYWYQGRGRIAHNEYRVKLNLLLDSALRRRSDEALVRIVVPVLDGDEAAATEIAVKAARVVIPSLERALPKS